MQHPDCKFKESEIRQIAEQNGVVFHHCDSFQAPRYDDISDLQKAVVVVYSSQTGHWQLAINEDGTVSKPGDAAREFYRRLQALVDSISGR